VAKGGENVIVVGEAVSDQRLAGATLVRPEDLATFDAAGSVIALAEGALGATSADVLEQQLKAGRPIFALNTTLADLELETGFLKASGLPKSPAADAKGQFSYVWLTYNERGDVAQSARGQMPLDGAYFQANLSQYSLLARGEIADIASGGKVIPLEQYESSSP